MRTIFRCTGAAVAVALPLLASAGPADAAVPDRTTFRSITAEGTGCPDGTAEVSISDDGLAFTTTFSALQANVEPGQRTSSRECQLTIQLHTPANRSLSVRSFAATGYAFAEDEVRTTYRAVYSVGGRAIAPTSAAHAPVMGPHDAGFVRRDDMPAGAEWTPCGTDHELVVDLIVSVESIDRQGAGYLNVASFDGSAEGESRVLDRACTPGGSEGGTTSPRRPGAPTPVRVQPRFTG